MKTKMLLIAVALLSSAFVSSATPSRSIPHASAAGPTFSGGVTYSHSDSTAAIHVDGITNNSSKTTNPLRLQLWATLAPPQVGKTISPVVLAQYALSPIAPSAVIGPVDSGNIAFTPPPALTRYYITLALGEFVAADNRYEYTDLFTFPGLQAFGALVLLESPPRGMVQAAGDVGATDTLVLRNVGDTQTNITLRTNNNFFTLFPSTIGLGPGESQRVTITGVASANGEYEGISTVSGDGVVPGFSIPVKLYSTSVPAGTVLPAALSNRVDVSGTIDQTPSGKASFTNNGTVPVDGFLVADVPWIVPQSGPVRINPLQPVIVNFAIDRGQRPDIGFMNGSVTGSLYLVYAKGSGNQKVLAVLPPQPGFVGVVVSDTAQPALDAELVKPIPGGQVALIIPGVGHILGSAGKEFISDVSILNRASGLVPPDLKLFYSSNGPGVFSTPPVAPGQSLLLSDVVTSYFGQQAQIGTMQIRSASTDVLSVNANVFNKSNFRGTYGTAIPVFRSNRSVASGEKLTLTGLRKDATAHTNVYLQEMSGVNSTAQIRFYNEQGVQVGATFETGTIIAFGLGILGPIVPMGAVTAVITNTSPGRFAAYATPVDDASGDTWAVADWNVQAGISGAEAMLVPVAGSAPGANGTNFRTDVAVTNIGTAAAPVTLSYYAGSDAPITKSVSLSPRQTQIFTDIVPSFFLVSGRSIGAIIARPQGGQFAISSRTYTSALGDPATFGTGVPTLPLSQSVRAGQSRQFGGVDDSTTSTVGAQRGATFRTNFALFETTGAPATVRVTVLSADGIPITAGEATASKTFPLAPFQFVQYSGLLRTVLGDSRDTSLGDLHNLQVKFEVVDGSGAVTPFITATDNGTGDTVLRTE